MPPHRQYFTIALTAISRFLQFRDRILEALGSAPHGDFSGHPAIRYTIPSSPNLLDAVFVLPSQAPARAALLICHGIGETVRRWLPVQQLLAAHGVASLVFDYSGYGRSTGSIDYTQCEQDSVAAFQYLERLAPQLPASILGFSMGSGVVAAIANRVHPHLLILGAAFPSFRAAARAARIPAALTNHVPPIWDARDSLRACAAPILIVHGEKDALFPVHMARQVAACCPGPVELLIAPGIGHNQPFRRPRLDYWGPILARLMPG